MKSLMEETMNERVSCISQTIGVAVAMNLTISGSHMKKRDRHLSIPMSSLFEYSNVRYEMGSETSSQQVEPISATRALWWLGFPQTALVMQTITLHLVYSREETTHCPDRGITIYLMFVDVGYSVE